ncbi:MAG: hypothetical protein ABSG39_09295 [Acidimicrobiales bacterium]
MEQWQQFELRVRTLYTQMVRVEITPDEAKLLDFEQWIPSAVAELVHGNRSP